MRTPSIHAAGRQRGATLVVGLILLTLITVMVVGAFSVSSTNVQSVGNMQLRDEAVAAANRGIELVMSSTFTAAPAAQTIDVDIDNDGAMDFHVDFEQPTCISAERMPSAGVPASSIFLGSSFGSSTGDTYLTVWDLKADVSAFDDGTVAQGTSVRVHQGVRVRLTEVEYNAVCSV
ncbi:MAG TPA: pilus assembly PilX N-terminal domain-containing protein [Steroidobacter sp.]|uniref:pilus assembly PilX family protein n=1 Tax=Steroidobacter sp. TaxID=1978227 RepID=UPI002EDB85AD